MRTRRCWLEPGGLWRAKGDALALGLILVAGAALRFYGLNWDGGHWLHPDERQIYFVVAGLGWPHSLREALGPDSPLNPAFFSYGSLSIYLLKAVAVFSALFWEPLADPDNLHWIGRPLAAVIDLGTVLLTYRLAKVLYPFQLPVLTSTPGAESSAGSVSQPSGRPRPRRSAPRLIQNRVALLAAALVALGLLHVQLAHFYTADTLLAFTVMLTLNLAASVVKGGGMWHLLGLGAAFGLALATKVSAFPLVLAVAAACAAPSLAGGRQAGDRDGTLSAAAVRMLVAFGVAALVFVAMQPYVLIDGRTFVAHTVRESQIARGAFDVPYTRQYAGTVPYLYSMWQTALWGLGLPLGSVAWIALGVTIAGWLRRGGLKETLLLSWAVPYLAVVGLLRVRYLRYMLPLVPVLCIVAASVLAGRDRRPRPVLLWGVITATGLFSLIFSTIYAEPHSWIAASEWIYRQVPARSTLAVEEWDTLLPLPAELDGRSRRADEFDLRTMTLYDEPDDEGKWSRLAADLSASDYAVVASRRLYGSIPRLPERYPVVSQYHAFLFGGNLGFELVAEFERGPTWLNPRLPPLPGAAPGLLHPDESFVVYDHPRALLFKNTEHLTAEQLLERLGFR